MKNEVGVVNVLMASATILMFVSGCGMLAERTIDKDSYYSYVGERPNINIPARKYEAAQGVVVASATNYGNVLKYLDQYLTLTKNKHQYISFIQANINLPAAMVAEKLLLLRKVNAAAFVEISQVFIQIRDKMPTLMIAQEYSSASLLKKEIGNMKVGMEADILSKKQVISDLTYQNLYAVSAAEFLDKQCILANAPEMRKVVKIIQQGN